MKFSDEDLDRIAEAVADKVELKLRREGRWPVYIVPSATPQPLAPQWWQPGGSPTCSTISADGPIAVAFN